MATTALQIERLIPASVPDNGNVIFDSVVHSSGTIRYDDISGIITIGAPGIYSINWWVAAQSASKDVAPVFTLISSKGDAVKGDSPNLPEEVVGFGIIKVITAPVTIRLTNTSGAELYFSGSVPVKAGLTVVENSAAQGPAGPAGPQGPMGPHGIQGPAGPQGQMGNTSYCFSVKQWAYVIDQLIRIYGTQTWAVYSTSIYPFFGTPYQLFPPRYTEASSLVMSYYTFNSAIPLSAIKAIYLPYSTKYDESISYLPAPSPLPPGCDTNVYTAMQSYLAQPSPLVGINIGYSGSVIAPLLKNEYGLVVLSGQYYGPSFFSPNHIESFWLVSDPPADKATK